MISLFDYMIHPSKQVVCNNCGVLNRKPYLVKNGLTIVKCTNCGLLYTNPRYHSEDLTKLYDQNYFKSRNPLILGYQNYLEEQKNLEKEADYYLELINQFTPLKKAKLLEIGCAFGFFLNLAHKQGADVSGVEISDFAAKTARQNFSLNVMAGFFPKIKLSQKFDVIVMWTTLEHVDDPLAYLRKASKLLKPNGFLFLSVPNADSLLARLTNKRWPGFQKVQEHNYFFTPVSLCNLLKQAHFVIIKKTGAPFFCRLDFIAKKLAVYNRFVSHFLQVIIKRTKLSDYSLNFGGMDMLIIAKKDEN